MYRDSISDILCDDVYDIGVYTLESIDVIQLTNGGDRRICLVTCDNAVFGIKPHLDTRQLGLVPEGADWTFHVERVETSLSIRLTHVEFGAVHYVRCEAGSALCQFVAQMTRV